MRYIFFLAFMFMSTVDSAQEKDSTIVMQDSTFLEASSDEETDAVAAPDTTQVTVRNFDEAAVEKLKADPAFEYMETPTVAESLWDRFLGWLRQFIESLFDDAVNTNWGRVLTYLLAFVVAVAVIMMLLKVNAFKVFYSAQGAETFKHQVLHENIHVMDFDKLIQAAVEQNDYRLGVRLLFLYALKTLSDKGLIQWDQGKTNHDYMNELRVNELRKGFTELNFYFEYAWYGNFNISANVFRHVRQIFDNWKSGVKG
ncbi:MAG: hypothetical protein WKF87_02000 [Chryseolinea sp.]